jgi:signal transduction histidine kinase
LRRLAIIAGVLILAVPLTRVAETLTSSSIRANMAEQQTERLRDAVAWIEADFSTLKEGLIRRATAVARDPNTGFLIQYDFKGGEPPEDIEAAIIRFQQDYRSEGSTSLELYGDDLELLAWSGASILPRPDPSSVVADSTVRIEADALRKALVVWLPSTGGGMVRAAEAIESSSPEASFLTHTDLEARWREATGLNLDVSFDGAEPQMPGTRRAVVPLENRLGERLGSVTITQESADAILVETTERYRHAEAFWWTLLLVLLASASWRLVEERFMPRRQAITALLECAVSRVAIILAVRYVLLWLDVPGSWLSRGSMGDAFDPAYLATEVWGGVARSVGDLALTGLFMLAASVSVLDVVSRYRPLPATSAWSPRTLFPAAVVTTVLLVAGVLVHAELSRQAMLDTTLDFFAWTRLSPEPLVLTVICALLLSTISAVVFGVSLIVLFWRWSRLDNEGMSDEGLRSNRWLRVLLVSGGALLTLAVFVAAGFVRMAALWILLLYLAAMLLPARYLLVSRPPLVRILRIRSLLATVLTAAVLLYPLLYAGMDEQRRLRLVDVAEDFAAEGDEASAAAVSAVLERLASAPETRAILASDEVLGGYHPTIRDFALLHPVVDLIPGIRRARVSFFDPGARPIASLVQDRRTAYLPSFSDEDRLDPTMLDVSEPGQPIVKPVLDARSSETTGHIGVMEIESDAGDVLGWVVLAVERPSIESPLGSLFSYPDWRRSLSLAEFVDGRRVRSEGEDFERYLLPPEVEERLEEHTEVWQDEEVYSRAYLTYYRKDVGNTGSVVAVRSRAVIAYDHLYYLLRIAISGLWLAAPAYVVGLGLRKRLGLIPARRRQYGDRVLDAFLIVGTLAVAGMGLIGQQVITRENEGAIRSRLERRLHRMEDFLVRSSRPNEPLYQVQRRIPVDVMSEELSLDLAVYRGPWLVETSAPISDAGPLMGYRLPAQAYDELFIKRFRQAFVESTNQYGEVYTIGYKALADAQGWPQSVVAVLTFPEQARIREERARTTSYFFGALLLLLLVIMATATTLARALTGPLKRLRDGMQSVAAGRVQRPIPVESSDEVGELVETFNIMQEQLSDSRRQLALQERELAWSEMARQVAHEIKNPLTPMKLSLQHLRRAFEESRESETAPRERFAHVFDRITRTVSEQIDTLADIANEFSTFARLPKRHLEVLDPNPVIREAVELAGTELKAGISFHETRQPVFVTIDRDELRRVLINLLKNAVQSVHEDGKVRVVAYVAERRQDSSRPDSFVCEVVDDGPGIEVEVQERMFQPNFSTKTSGMGLGLAIAKRSIEAMGGEIGFETEVGKGSTFWIKLPLVDA